MIELMIEQNHQKLKVISSMCKSVSNLISQKPIHFHFEGNQESLDVLTIYSKTQKN